MWRRIYSLLLLLRVYFALSPSYLHPDEVFQGPEVISGSFFPYPVHRTWEWTSEHPIRSVFPIWLFYGLPMYLLKSVWTRQEDGLVDPAAIYYALRMVMFILSFVLEDWAIYELVSSPRQRKQIVLLVASSYVTWTFQTHTFSNSIETLLVLWCLVLIERILKGEKKKPLSVPSSFLLGFLLVLGCFNRITFPAFILIPGLRLLPYFLDRPLFLLSLSASAAFWALIAIGADTAYYTGSGATKSFRALFASMKKTPVITILNNISYNKQTSNLAQHGIHPRYQHVLINLPQLLGPALLLLLWSIPKWRNSNLVEVLKNSRLTSAATGTLFLSIVPHQEPRFLLPCVPLLLTCLQLPTTPFARRAFWISWAIFNAALGLLMGVYHQGGVISTQMAMPSLITQSLSTIQSSASTAEVYWWKTYPPPTYLLGSNHTNPYAKTTFNISTIPLMGLKQPNLHNTLSDRLPPCNPTLLDEFTSFASPNPAEIYIAAPLSAWCFENEQAYPPISNFTFNLYGPATDVDVAVLKFKHIYTSHSHINLDDLDFGDDGFLPTIERAVGRKGLGVWHVERVCDGGKI